MTINAQYKDGCNQKIDIMCGAKLNQDSFNAHHLELELLSSIFVIAAITIKWLIYMKVYAASITPS